MSARSFARHFVAETGSTPPPNVAKLLASNPADRYGGARAIRADLESAAGVDVALVVAVDDDVVGLDRAAHLRLRADDQRPLALDLALRLALGRRPVAVFEGHRNEAMGVISHLPNLYRRVCLCSIPFRSPAATSAWRC